jgi:hypothetical protein
MRTFYYPQFTNQSELDNHYFRARWYIAPRRLNSETAFYCSADCKKPTTPPEYMAKRSYDESHLKILYSKLKVILLFFRSENIILWRQSQNDWKVKIICSFLKKNIINLDTNDPSASEFGRYCDFSWKNSLTRQEQDEIIEQSHQKLITIHREFNNKFSKACVFGTGPSLDEALKYNFEDIFTVVCNSIVQNEKLIKHIKPNFITAGDVVSHFGISRYAEQFREDLVKILKNTDCYFLTTAPFGYLFYAQNPDLQDKIILVQQKPGGANFSLIDDFYLPQLDSTMNIHMLPLAATFANEIYIIGSDGKNPAPDKNEDFWAHSKNGQYHDLVATGHLCHPTFDGLRQKSTYQKYLKSLQESITKGEQFYSKKYFSLTHSYIEILSARLLEIPSEESDHLIKLKNISH